MTQDTLKASSPSKNGEGAFPRLGESHTAKQKTKEVTIPDLGATVLLRKPSVGTIIAIQPRVEEAGEDTQKAFESSVALVAEMLVEPDWSEKQLREAVEDWAFSDWQALQTAAMELAGMSEEAQRKSREEFPDSKD